MPFLVANADFFVVNDDPDTDPDPAFKVNAHSDPDPGFLWSKIAIYLSLGLRKGRPSHRRGLQPSKENIQYLNFFPFFYQNHWVSMWIWIRNQGYGSVSGSAWIRINLSCGSGSSRAKMTHKNRKKARIFMFSCTGCSLLRAEGFFCNLGVLYGGLGISKLQFLIKKIKIKFPAINFSNFRSSNPGSGSGIRIRNPDPQLYKMPDPHWINADPKPCPKLCFGVGIQR